MERRKGENKRKDSSIVWKQTIRAPRAPAATWQPSSGQREDPEGPVVPQRERAGVRAWTFVYTAPSMCSALTKPPNSLEEKGEVRPSLCLGTDLKSPGQQALLTAPRLFVAQVSGATELPGEKHEALGTKTVRISSFL